jgi:hypothetical protein
LNNDLSIPVKRTLSVGYITRLLSDSSNNVQLSASDFAGVIPPNH